MTEALTHRGTVLLGGFGSGKTEVSIALARRLAAAGESPYLIDLDIVTPYFRPRDIADELGEAGVRVIAPKGDVSRSPLPALTGEASSVIRRAARGEVTAIIDPGGDAAGARVMRSLADETERAELLAVYLLNDRRAPYAGELATESIASVQNASGIRVTHLASNTHLGSETTEKIVLDGLDWAKAISESENLPLLFAACLSELCEGVSRRAPDVPLLPLTPSLGLPWHHASPAATGEEQV